MTSGDRNKQHLIPSGHGKKRNWDGGAGAAVLRPPDQRRHTPSMSDGLGQDANIYYSGSLWSPSGRALFGKLGARYVRLAGRHHSSCAQMARACTAHVSSRGPTLWMGRTLAPLLGTCHVFKVPGSLWSPFPNPHFVCVASSALLCVSREESEAPPRHVCRTG